MEFWCVIIAGGKGHKADTCWKGKGGKGVQEVGQGEECIQEIGEVACSSVFWEIGAVEKGGGRGGGNSHAQVSG